MKRTSEDGMTDKVVCDELGISSRQLDTVLRAYFRPFDLP
jgi:hypothetical protein